MEVVFTPTAEDYVAAQRAMFARLLRSRKFVGRMAWLLGGLAGAIGLMVLAAGDAPLLALLTGFGVAVCGAAGLAACIGVNRLLLPRRARRLFVQQKTLHYEQRSVFDATGFRQASARGEVVAPWPELLGWYLGRDMLLLYSNELLAYFIPVRAFAPAQLTQVQAILAQSGLPRR